MDDSESIIEENFAEHCRQFGLVAKDVEVLKMKEQLAKPIADYQYNIQPPNMHMTVRIDSLESMIKSMDAKLQVRFALKLIIVLADQRERERIPTLLIIPALKKL